MVRDDYAWMARDATESERLDVQHRLLVQAVGYVLHPKIPIPPNARIADIATGTGVLLRDLSQTLPSTCHFDGFDISSAQFPSKSRLPPNISLHVADVKQPLPSEFHGQFDVVNIRYLNAGMADSDWAVVTRNVSALLKPGGWFQWIEGDFSQARIWYQFDPVKRPSSGAPQELSELFADAVDRFRYFIFHLAAIFRETGLKDVVQEVASTDRVPETRPQWAPTFMGPLMSFAKMQAKVHGKSMEHCSQLRDRVLDEAKAGVIYSRIDVHTFLGRKA